MPPRIVSAIVLAAIVTAASAESITYELYDVSGDDRILLAKGTKEYSAADIRTEERNAGRYHWWDKELIVAKGFAAGASIYQEADLSGFALWLKDRGSVMGKLANGGTSFDWFERENGNVYRKIQGGGRVRVTFIPSAPLQEIKSVEVIEDITLRLRDRPAITFPQHDTHHLVLRKGSLLQFAP